MCNFLHKIRIQIYKNFFVLYIHLEEYIKTIHIQNMESFDTYEKIAFC